MISSFFPARVAEPLHPHSKLVIVKAFLEQICAGRGRVLQDITGFNRPRVNPVRINLRGGLKALRSLSFRSLIQDPQKSVSVQLILFSPNYVNALSLLAAHGTTMQQGVSENAEKCSGEIQNV